MLCQYTTLTLYEVQAYLNSFESSESCIKDEWCQYFARSLNGKSVKQIGMEREVDLIYDLYCFGQWIINSVAVSVRMFLMYMTKQEIVKVHFEVVVGC